jgi:hypothetical protein
METLGATAEDVPEVSGRNWAKLAFFGRGTTGLSQVAGGPYAGSNYYFNNTSQGGNAEGISTLTGIPVNRLESPYATWHNTNIGPNSWAFETNVWLTSLGAATPYEGGLYHSQISGIRISQSGFSTYRLSVALGNSSSDTGGTSVIISMPNFTGGAWHHLVVQGVKQSAGIYKIYVFVNGVLQNTGGTSIGAGGTWGLWATPSYGPMVGASGGPSANPFRIDNTRMIQGAPFNLAGFTPPTGAWTA